MKRTVNWGIIGAGGIAELFAADLASVEGARLKAVAARSLKRAQDFAARHGIEKAYGSYRELAEDDSIDVVYISTIHPLHKEHSLLCIKNGKAVLCEKPFTMNAGEAQELIDAARQKGLFLMEAVWSRFLPSNLKAMEWIREGRIGKIMMIDGGFAFKAKFDPEGKHFNRAMGGGALLDLGIYPINMSSYFLGKNPVDIKSSVVIGSTGVDEMVAIILTYDEGEMASLKCGLTLDIHNNMIIYGTEGRIELPLFWMGNEAKLYSKDRLIDHAKFSYGQKGYGFEAQEVMKCLAENKLESDIMPLDDTLEVMKVMDIIQKQW